MSSAPELPYHLGRTERRGAVLGWRPGQALAVAVGAGALVLGLGAGGAAAAFLGVVVSVVAMVIAALPVRGRGLDEWVPVAVSFVARPRRGALCAGAIAVPGDGDAGHLQWPDGRSTTVVELRHLGLRALDDEPRAVGEALARWLRALGEASLASLSVTLLTRTGAGGLPPRDAPWVDAGLATSTYVAATSLVSFDVAASLGAAGVRDAVALDADDLDGLLGARTAPAMGSLLACDVVARWRYLEAPSSVHAAFAVEEWPSGGVDEQVLTALCVSRDRRCVALSLRTEELARARDRTAKVRTSAAADEAVVARGGFLASPEAERDTARDAERAAELAAGHGSLRLVGVVALDACDVLGLEASAARLLADATACGVRLRRCDGDHARGVLASVPGWCVP
jgi:hypothetical protein